MADGRDVGFECIAMADTELKNANHQAIAPCVSDCNQRDLIKPTMRKPRVLQFICPTGIYGAERWILALANNLSAERVTVELAITRESGQQNMAVFNNSGHPCHEIPLRNPFDLSAIRQLARLLRERGIDILHTHGYKSDIIGLLAAKWAGVKVVATPHGFGEAKHAKLKLYKWLGGYALRFANVVAPLSAQLQQEVEALGVRADTIHYIQNGVDLTEIDRRLAECGNNVPATASSSRIGYIGQIIPRKKLQLLLSVFDQLWTTDPSLELVIVGDGPDRPAMEAIASALPSAAKIQFTGFRSDRLAILSELDVFVMTSSSEGIPRCMMEAMAMETPVAAFAIPGIDQLLIHEQTGMLAPYAQTELLAAHIQRLLDDKAFARSLASRGRQFIVRHFSAKRMADQYSSVYEELLR